MISAAKIKAEKIVTVSLGGGSTDDGSVPLLLLLLLPPGLGRDGWGWRRITLDGAGLELGSTSSSRPSSLGWPSAEEGACGFATGAVLARSPGSGGLHPRGHPVLAAAETCWWCHEHGSQLPSFGQGEGTADSTTTCAASTQGHLHPPRCAGSVNSFSSGTTTGQLLDR